jgi:dinuclear metal center YbgI/SA1388 family protein
MKISDIIDTIESFAPLAAQESYDNAGLLVGDPGAEVTSALLCVDITEEVMDEAERSGVGMVISHHPVIFLPLRNITGDGYEQRVVARALRSGIALYAAHTNLDSAPGGMSHFLAGQLGLGEITTLDRQAGLGVVGELSAPMAAADFLKHVARTLDIGAIRHSALPAAPLSRVALCTGAGGELIPEARKAGAQLYMSADLKFHNFLQAAGAMPVADIGHHESERCAVELLFSVISKKFPTFALRKSVRGTNPVHYLVNI